MPPVAELGPVIGSLCTGYGGLDLGVLTALGGGRIAWVADPDRHIAQILAARMPGVPNLGDLRHIDWAAVESVDVVVAGWPCQDISAAGKRAGIEKGRRSGLWTDIVAGLRVLRPTHVVLENVAALRWKGGGLHRVLGDLAEAGYDAAWRSVRAADIGAPHRRERVFLLAWRRDLGTAAHPDRLRRPESHAPHPHRRPPTTGSGTAAAHTPGLGHRDDRPQSRTGIPATAVPAGTATGGPTAPAADTARHGRDEGLPGAARLERRPDAALSSHPPDHPDNRRRHRRPLATVPDVTLPVSAAAADEPPRPMHWDAYEAAIRRWETVLGRPTPHPTQPGNHGRPVLAPTFVEHLMGLPRGWVTDLPLPRTAQLRALGNGVVPHQAAHAVSLLLDDLAEALDTDQRPATGRETSAA